MCCRQEGAAIVRRQMGNSKKLYTIGDEVRTVAKVYMCFAVAKLCQVFCARDMTGVICLDGQPTF